MQMPKTTGKITAPARQQFEGLAIYSDEREALVVENCNDALHLYYPDKLAKQVKLFLSGFKGDCLYAVKTNPHPAILKHLWMLGVRRFEVASRREVAFVLELLPDAELYFMHPVKSRQAIRDAYERGVRVFAYDSADELRKIEEETDHAIDLNLFLRLRVDQTTAAHPLNDKFGASMSEAPLLLQRAARSASCLGLTFHVGSQCMDPASYVLAIDQLAEMLETSGCRIECLDVGGGFPVSYPGMEPPELSCYFSAIHSALANIGMGDISLLCEPGRALVAEAGSVAVRVEMRKGHMLYLNDGTYGALFDAGASAWPYPLQVVQQDMSAGQEKHSDFKFFGPTCDSLDVMEGPFSLPDTIREGDWIIFHHLGAYGYSMQTRFNGFYSDNIVAIS